MPQRAHGPENAEFELRKAYNSVIEGAIPYLWENRVVQGVHPDEALVLYKHAYNAYRKGNKLAAERWARTAKHLSRALALEAKIAYLEAHDTDLPSLESTSPAAFGVLEKSDTTADLLNSVAEHIPVGFERMPQAMSRYLNLARDHLRVLEREGYHHELLRAERIHVAHEYGRVLEIMALAYEAEAPQRKSA